jgi:hypothetical protein
LYFDRKDTFYFFILVTLQARGVGLSAASPRPLRFAAPPAGYPLQSLARRAPSSKNAAPCPKNAFHPWQAENRQVCFTSRLFMRKDLYLIFCRKNAENEKIDSKDFFDYLNEKKNRSREKKIRSRKKNNLSNGGEKSLSRFGEKSRKNLPQGSGRIKNRRINQLIIRYIIRFGGKEAFRYP